uniref:DNA2/NAM7 helicase helicase domain-containing protein n=1 Tax=Ditylenchus dipsaci TaxID=166011 RepID=A0A915E8U2_9BILA
MCICEDSGEEHSREISRILSSMKAGQANELETLIPIAGLALDKTKIVLAGDSKQLGPVESVLYIHKKNLTKSLMERNAECECYKGDKRLTCMLEENYRSHPAIIKVSSELFTAVVYVQLRTRRTPRILCQFESLPTKGFPIISIISGSGGDYVKKILQTTDVKPDEIGIISPYRYQVRLLRENVFNTTIMRAEELLIVLGNQELLCKQSSWRCFIQDCADNKAIIMEFRCLKLELRM